MERTVDAKSMEHNVLKVICLFLVAASSALPQDNLKPIYQDPNAAIQGRVRDLLNRMTIEEKVAQLESGCNYPDLPGTTPPSIFDKDRLNEALVRKTLANGLGTYAFLDEFTSLVDGPVPSWTGAHQRNLLQHWVMANTRLAIPIMFHGEALHGAVTKGATSFPQAVALGSTWDPVLIEKMFSAVALESRALGNSMVLAPVLDLSRDPRYGRTEEMYSEDPYLVAEMGVAAVRGLQGQSERLDQNHVFATAKHFVHGQPENGTNAGPSDFSEHTMRSVFLYPFEQAVEKAHIEAVMPSYNTTLGGIPSNANPWLLKEMLRNEWGFTGITVSDYTAISELTTLNHVAPDLAAAGTLALKSGVDMELPSPAAFPSLVSAVQSGRVSEKQLNEATEHVLTAKFRAGLFEHPYVDENRAASEVGSEQRKALSRQVADEAIVLLKNTDHLLPLDPAKIRTLAVIGPNADKVRIGSYGGIPPYFVTALAGIQKRAGTGTKVVYAEGCRISEPDTAPNSNGYLPYKAPDESNDRKLMDEAVDTARSADVIILVLGGNEAVSRESTGNPLFGDSDTLELPGHQNELVQKISSLRKPIVAVLLNGKAYSIDQLTSTTQAIVEGWYLGQETGNAIADVLFGDINPSGHLPVTIARNVGQLPVYYYKTPAARRGYVFDRNTPLLPFGFGLSYTTFTFGKPTLDRERISPGETAHVAVTVTNSGSCAGDEVVQMYIHHEQSSIVQPIQMLRGFKRVHLDPGSSAAVNFDVGPEQLSILNVEMKRVVESGPVEVWIGSNSADTEKIRLMVSE
jgi:beta-glucosidase